MTTSTKNPGAKALAKKAGPKGTKLTSKEARAGAHKAPERRNENKVRGR